MRPKRFSSGRFVIYENKKIKYIFDAVNKSNDQACRDLNNNEIFAIHENLDKSQETRYTIYTCDKSISLIPKKSCYYIMEEDDKVGELKYGKTDKEIMLLGIDSIKITGWGKLYANVDYDDNDYYFIGLGLLVIYFSDNID